MKPLRFVWILLALVCFAPGCANRGGAASSKGRAWDKALGPVPHSKISPQQLSQAVNMRRSYIPRGRYGRRQYRPMTPSYITIHSTQNYSGDAWAHAKALNRGALRGGTIGYLCWHFTVQDDVVVQHIPTSERGEHADFDGPGNRTSIAIEMCEHRGNNQAQTIDRTAQLTASLMYYHKIPLSHVVPHYHWPREGYSPAHKDCPHFLLENGRPGATWEWFLNRVNQHYKRISP
jgi:N-acetylmuramoyl-L-alanine amidase